MKYILAGLTVLFSLAGYSQNKQFLYYFDQDLNPASKSQSTFKGIGISEDGTLEFKLYDSHTNNLLSIEHYTDSSLKIQKGLFQTFFRNGTLASENNYVNGLQDGLSIRWDSTGHIIDSTIYNNDKKILEVHTGYYSNGKLDSLVVNDIKADHLDRTFYNDKGNLVYEVNFIGDKGIIKRYDSTMHVTIDTATNRLEIEASFPGGEAAWTRYIISQIQSNLSTLQDAGVSGTCRVKFLVRKDGIISNVVAITMQGTKLAKIAVDIISHGPKWNPASQYGRVVNAFREQPITFQVQSR